MTRYQTCPCCGHVFPDWLGRFWDNVDRRGDDECWPWKGRKLRDLGYGVFMKDGQTKIATRVMWEVAHGEVLPRDVFMCHRCDNPNCVNPSHLFSGTAADNHRDKILKGRGRVNNKPLRSKPHYWVAKGQGNGAAKLTEDQVRAIRQRYSQGGVLQSEIARDYGVTPQCINQVVRRITFRDLPD